MTLGSLFDGSGTALLAATMCGITPVWAAEIEPYPIAVTHTHFPDVIHLGDVARIDGGKIPPVDVIVFGSPCQDMSVAGKRAGMQHTKHGDEETTRSGLFYEAVRIIREMRGATNGEYPTFAVWENVPGAFSSNDGEDFRCVLEELANIGGGGLQFLDLRAGHGNLLGFAWETVLASHGACSMLNFGECPSAAVESTLSQILEADAPAKYSLSATACAGILRRAAKRGKALPPVLETALRAVIESIPSTTRRQDTGAEVQPATATALGTVSG